MDLKNYVVRYNLVADTKEITGALEAVQKMAANMAEPIQRVQKAMLQMANTMKLVKENSRLEFRPTVNKTAFVEGLKALEQEALGSAKRIQESLNRAFTGKPFSRVEELNKQIAEAERRLAGLGKKSGRKWVGGEIERQQELKAGKNVISALKKEADDLSKKTIPTLKKELAKAVKEEKKLGKGGKGLTVGVTAQVEKIIAPEGMLVTGLVGEISKITAKSGAALPVEAKIKPSDVKRAIKDIKSPVINLLPKFKQADVNAALKGVKTPTVKLTLDVSQAKAVLQELVGEIKASSPQTIKLNAQAQVQYAEEAKIQSRIERQSRAARTSTPSVGSSRFAATPPVYDRMRTWLYPFAGNTSFGARTPMAVDMAKGMGVMMAVGGAMSAVGNSLSQAMEYQNIMKTTQAILKNGTKTYTDSGFHEMEHIVRRVGMETKFTAPEVAGAAKFLAMAGQDIPMINASIRPIADLALIGDNDLAEVADKMTNIMASFNIKPNQMRDVANIMATTATRSNVDLMMLAESAKYAGAVANLYNGDFWANFADTMAMFGIMGNAGIQASSAGTALRMMYQNLMRPNKRQRNALESAGIRTRDANNAPLPMMEILQQIAAVDKSKLSDLVGQLFRITAQPGAASLLNTLTHGDAEQNASAINAGEKLIKLFNDTSGSELINLMIANRKATGTTISQNIADEKKNTIAGLWAQATSTFTEAIVKSFEGRQGGFAKMLRAVRDYFAKPETVKMLDKIVDLVITLGKLGATFVKGWAGIYQTFPNIVKGWMWVSMFLTQLGFLVSPLVQLTSVVSRLGSILRFLGFSAPAAGAARGIMSAVGGNALGADIANMAGGAASSLLPMKLPKRNYQKIITQAQAMGWALPVTTTNRNKAARARMAAAFIQRRPGQLQNASLLYRTAQVNAYKKGAWGRAFGQALYAGTMLTPQIAFGRIAQSFKNMTIVMARGIGALASPVGLLTLAISGAVAGIIATHKKIKGVINEQENALKQASSIGQKNRKKEYAGAVYNHIGDVVNSTNYYYGAPGSSGDNPKGKTDYSKLFPELYVNGSHISGKQERAINNAIRQTPNYRLLGLQLDNRPKISTGDYLHFAYGNDPFGYVYNPLEKSNAQPLDNAINVVKAAGASSPAVLEGQKKIIALRKQLLNKKINQGEFASRVKDIIDKTVVTENLRPITSVQDIRDNKYNWGIYKEFQEGASKVLYAEANAVKGTESARIMAGSKIKNGVKAFSEDWWNQMGSLIDGMTLSWKIGKKTERITLSTLDQASKMPGRLDFHKIIDGVRKICGDFGTSIRLLADTAASVYLKLAKMGVVSTKHIEPIKKFIYEPLKDEVVHKWDAEQYYDTHVGKVAGLDKYTKNDFVKGVINNKAGDGFGAWRVRIRNSMATVAAMGVQKQYKDDLKVAEDLKKHITNQKTTGGGNDTNTSTGTDSGKSTDQSGYGSKYDRSSAKPTQIIINIQNLANFDKTQIASSAQERDMISAMESRIAEALSRLTAELVPLYAGAMGGAVN